MTTAILESIHAAEATRRAALLRTYRDMLASDQPKDADALLKVSRELGFSLGRLHDHLEAVHNEKQLKDAASDLDAATVEHREAFTSAEKHRTSMEKKIAALREKQLELDSLDSSALGRVRRAESAARELEALHVEQSELFADVAEERAAVEHQRLQSLVDELPELRQQLAEAEARVAELNEQFEVAAYATSRCHPGSDGQREAIAERDKLAAERSQAVGLVASLHDKIDERESIRRTLLRDQDQEGADSV